MESVTLSLPEAYDLALEVLSANGFSDDHAEAIARNVTDGERAGKALPEGWGIDSQGQPTTDAAEVLNGAMLTFGGHKGSALAAMVELLAGPLIGDMTSAESLAWDNGAGGLPYGGELILALDPQRFLGAQAPEQLARAETLFMGMQEQGARLPGERRFACRQQSERQGVIISRSLHDEICALRQGG